MEQAQIEQALVNFGLVSDALKAEPVKSGFLEEFDRLITDEFIPFCGIESVNNDALTLQDLQRLQKEMRLIANFPSLHSKTLGAIGGGFSSGKSSFVNSFIAEGGVHLAVGIRPVTAIPSYVVQDKKQSVQGVTYKGGRFGIGLDLYRKIDHEMLRSFSFNLKEIILYTTVLCPMDKALFGSICLIDTPGYNPPASGAAATDFSTASEYIRDASFLIWMVGLDSNGTIPKSDLDFLKSLPFGTDKDRALYIVANKAELKSGDDLEDILDTFEENLDDYDIRYDGISAYSSAKKRVYASRKADVYEFLKRINRPSRKYGELSGTLEGVFRVYADEIERDHEEKEAKRREIRDLLLDAFEDGKIGLDETSNKLEEGLNSLISYFRPEKLEDRMNRVNGILEKFKACLDGFCDEMGINRNPEPEETEDESLDDAIAENPKPEETEDESPDDTISEAADPKYETEPEPAESDAERLSRLFGGKTAPSALASLLSRAKTSETAGPEDETEPEPAESGKEKETPEALGKMIAAPANQPMRAVAAGRSQEGQCGVSGWEDIVSIAAGGNYTVGVRVDGTLIFAGKDYPSISDWKGIRTIAAQGKYAAGLREDGTVVTSFNAGVSGWENISAIAVGQGDQSERAAHIVGLREDGTVAAAGHNQYGQCNVTGWANVVSIAAFDYCTLGVREDGTVLRTGRSPDSSGKTVSVSGWKNIAAIAGVRVSHDDERITVLRKDETICTKEGNGRDITYPQWQDITAIAMPYSPYYYCIVGLRKNGTVVIMCNKDHFSKFEGVTAWEDITAIAAGNDHVVGLQKYQ